jgi:GNAT superfamily N-acetyltransferase
VDRTQTLWADGRAAAAIRQVRPADEAALSDFFAGLSEQSRYLRFFGPVTPGPALLRLLIGDPGRANPGRANPGRANPGRAHPRRAHPRRADSGQARSGQASSGQARSGQASAGRTDAVVAVRGRVIIGHAMAVDHADPDDPRSPRTTDIGVVVADAWQGRGVGAALVRALITGAQERGVTSVVMEVLPGNRRVLTMISSHWPAARVAHSPDCVSIRIPLPPDQQRRPPAPPAGLPAAASASLAGIKRRLAVP